MFARIISARLGFEVEEFWGHVRHLRNEHFYPNEHLLSRGPCFRFTWGLICIFKGAFNPQRLCISLSKSSLDHHSLDSIRLPKTQAFVIANVHTGNSGKIVEIKTNCRVNAKNEHEPNAERKQARAS